MIKLLALDLDGTTVDSSGSVPLRNREAIRAAEEKGVLVTIATGRRFRDAQPVGLDLGLNAPLITHNGALLKYAQSLETAHASLISPETSLEIIRVGKTLGGDALVSTDPTGLGTLLYDRVSAGNTPLQKYITWSESLHGENAQRSVLMVQDLAAAITDHDTVHISFSGTCSTMAEMQGLLAESLGDTVTILATIYPKLDFTLLDVLPPDASKGHGLAKLAELNGLSAEQVMAIGDNFNDLEMLDWAGTGVVMGNADQTLIDRDDLHTTSTNNDCGVAAAIERFILQES